MVCEILGKYIQKEKNLIDDILGPDYKRLNRYFEIARIKYGERPPPAYSRTAKPGIENVTRKKRAGGLVARKISEKKKTSRDEIFLDVEDVIDDFDEIPDSQANPDSQVDLSQQARDAEVRMIAQTFDSGDTPSLLTPLAPCFQNLLSSVGLDNTSAELPLAREVSIDTSIPIGPAVMPEVPEDGEVLSSQASLETAGPSSQRFVSDTPIMDVPVGEAEVACDAVNASAPEIERLNVDTSDGSKNASKIVSDSNVCDASKVQPRKGTLIASIDFDDFDDDVFDEEAEEARSSRLTGSTVNVNTGEKVDCHLEEGVTTG